MEQNHRRRSDSNNMLIRQLEAKKEVELMSLMTQLGVSN